MHCGHHAPAAIVAVRRRELVPEAAAPFVLAVAAFAQLARRATAPHCSAWSRNGGRSLA
jgi:hypothetical protein